MERYQCSVCDHIYDVESGGQAWNALPDDWCCPVCGAEKSAFQPMESVGNAVEVVSSDPPDDEDAKPQASKEYLAAWKRPPDGLETHLADIHLMATTGRSITEPMRTRNQVADWDDLLLQGAQLAKLPLNADEPVNLQTVIGPGSKHPLVIETPIFVSHMSFGALSREAKIALAQGSAGVKTSICSGEGGILEDEFAAAHKYIFEYVPNQYSVTEENLRRVDAIEIKFGQSAKPGMGGHLPGDKVTQEIALVRNRPEGTDIHSPAHFDDIRNADDLQSRIEWLREKSGGKPVGVKLAAGNIEADLEVALLGRPDFITLDGRPGATGSAPKFIKHATSVPTIFALFRARKFLDAQDAKEVSLIITGGLRVSSDFAKALALGADAVALASAALMAIGCQQYRICNTGRCPVGITSQDPQLRARLDIEQSAQRLEAYLRVCTDELASFARLTGNDTIHAMSLTDLCTTNSEISSHTAIEHV